MKPKKLRIVHVKWLDASALDSRWVKRKDARKAIKLHAHSFGALVRRDRRFTILCMNMTDDAFDPRFSTFMEIPSPLVKSIRTIAWAYPSDMRDRGGLKQEKGERR